MAGRRSDLMDLRELMRSCKHFEPECDSAGDGPAPSDDSPVSAMGCDPGPA